MKGDSNEYDKLELIFQDGSSQPQNLTLEDLRNITNNFSEEQLLGKGGFGKVYKGILQDGRIIAVKKFASLLPEVAEKHFENEAKNLMSLEHENIVRLFGCCTSTENIYMEYDGKTICAVNLERLLYFEFMPKNLRKYISDESSGLTWETRYQIIRGICFGLHYLHEEWQVNTPIIHMDLKPDNILLDDNMVPKIADFGLSRMFSEEETRIRTRSFDGTFGYMAPEYIQHGEISKQSDIFSLGVIIIEIMIGHKDYPDEFGVSSSQIECPHEFVEMVLNNWSRRLEREQGNESLITDCQQIRQCIHIGLDCVKFDRERRPRSTFEIIRMLDGLGGAENSYSEQAAEGWRMRGHHIDDHIFRIISFMALLAFCNLKLPTTPQVMLFNFLSFFALVVTIMLKRSKKLSAVKVLLGVGVSALLSPQAILGIRAFSLRLYIELALLVVSSLLVSKVRLSWAIDAGGEAKNYDEMLDAASKAATCFTYSVFGGACGIVLMLFKIPGPAALFVFLHIFPLISSVAIIRWRLSRFIKDVRGNTIPRPIVIAWARIFNSLVLWLLVKMVWEEAFVSPRWLSVAVIGPFIFTITPCTLLSLCLERFGHARGNLLENMEARLKGKENLVTMGMAVTHGATMWILGHQNQKNVFMVFLTWASVSSYGFMLLMASRIHRRGYTFAWIFSIWWGNNDSPAM